MKIAVAGDSAGEALAKVLADHLKDTHEVSEISRTSEGPDPFYANLADRVASAVMALWFVRMDDIVLLRFIFIASSTSAENGPARDCRLPLIVDDV